MSKDIRNVTSEHLIRILSNEYFLYLKSLNFHWNITGENLISLHELLEAHYEWLKETIDEIAERIRTIGCVARGSYKGYAKKISISNKNDIENQTAQSILHRAC